MSSHPSPHASILAPSHHRPSLSFVSSLTSPPSLPLSSYAHIPQSRDLIIRVHGEISVAFEEGEGEVKQVSVAFEERVKVKVEQVSVAFEERVKVKVEQVQEGSLR